MHNLEEMNKLFETLLNAFLIVVITAFLLGSFVLAFRAAAVMQLEEDFLESYNE